MSKVLLICTIFLPKAFLRYYFTTERDLDSKNNKEVGYIHSNYYSIATF